MNAGFRRNVEQNWGETGRAWLADLPTLIARLMSDWDLSPAGRLPLSINWVGRVRRADGSGAVLKLGVPASGHLVDEATALEFFDGRAAIRVLARDDDRGALLLEEARPGTPAASLTPADDTAATGVLIGVIRRLHRPAPARIALPDLADRIASFHAHLRRFPGDDPLPRHLVHRAAELFQDLCATATGRVVLHGDLHHDNVLSAEREPWLAIDPHGVVGDPGYEVGAMLYNPTGHSHDPNPDAPGDTVLDAFEARAEQLADGLAMPYDRVVAWGFVQAVLSGIWSCEGAALTCGRPLRLAHRLLPLLA